MYKNEWNSGLEADEGYTGLRGRRREKTGIDYLRGDDSAEELHIVRTYGRVHTYEAADEIGELRIQENSGLVRIPRNMVRRIIGYMLNKNIQAKLARPGQRLSYHELLKQECEDNPDLGQLYLGDIPIGIDFYLSGEGAKALIASMQA